MREPRLVILYISWGISLCLFGCSSHQSASGDINAITGASPRARSPVEITDKSTYDALTFNPSEKKYGIISYVLSKSAGVRVRIVRRGQKELLLRTLVDWSRREAGKNIERWDARDASGNLIDNKKCFIIIEADSKVHQKHDREKCHELQVKITSPENSETVVRGLFKVSATIVGDRSYGEQSGYKVRFYGDYVLASRISLSSDAQKVDINWDTTALNNGEHLITVNIDDRHDHLGTASMKAVVEN